MTTVTIYNNTGDHVLAGTSKGKLNIIDAKTHEIIFQTKVCNGVVTTLRLAGSGRELLVNGQDKIIKTFRVPDLSAEDMDPDTITAHRAQVPGHCEQLLLESCHIRLYRRVRSSVDV